MHIIHGTEDRFVPPSMSEEIHRLRGKLAPTELCLIPGASHANAILTNRETYETRLDAFIRSVEK